MSRSTVWVVIKIQTFSASLMRDNTVFNATSKESVLAVICWCSRDNITPAIKSLSLFLAYFQSVVRRMHAGCLFVFFYVKMVTPTSTHWNWREISVTNISPKSFISLSETELCRPCFRVLCTSWGCISTQSFNSLSWCSEKKGHILAHSHLHDL